MEVPAALALLTPQPACSVSSAVKAARQSVMLEGALPAENQLDSPLRASRTSGRLSPCNEDWSALGFQGLADSGRLTLPCSGRQFGN